MASAEPNEFLANYLKRRKTSNHLEYFRDPTLLQLGRELIPNFHPNYDGRFKTEEDIRNQLRFGEDQPGPCQPSTSGARPKRKPIEPSPTCVFCKNNGQPPTVYKGHFVRDPVTDKVTCPMLMAKPPCKHCGAFGENNHTERYCPRKYAQKLSNLNLTD